MTDVFDRLDRVLLRLTTTDDKALSNVLWKVSIVDIM